MGNCCSIAPNPPCNPKENEGWAELAKAPSAVHPETKHDEPLKPFSYDVLYAATDGFSPCLVLGEGAFGRVYKGRLSTVAYGAPGSEFNVAVKKMVEGAQGGSADKGRASESVGEEGIVELINEVRMLEKHRHRNLVRLIGYCVEGGHAALVYPLYTRGSLDRHLFTDRVSVAGTVEKIPESELLTPLTWAQRMKIALGVADALRYLHEENIIHRDLKPHNILLEEDLTPVVSDFGLARSGPEGDSSTHVSTRLMGSFGYLDPNYAVTCHLTQASDVYALGMVLLELMSGRRAMQEKLVCWLRAWKVEKDPEVLDKLVDPRLHGAYSQQGAAKVASLALHCISAHPHSRPPMIKVVKSLTLAAQCN